MVSSREALIDGGLELTRRPGGGHSESAAARGAVDRVKRGPRTVKNRTSRELGQRALPEATAAATRYRIRPAERVVSRRELAESLAEIRRLRPKLPVESVVGGKLTAGLNAREHDGGWLLGCVSVNHWTRNLTTNGFPAGVRVTVYGPNGILIQPLAAEEPESED